MKQSNEFTRDRLLCGTKSLYDIIHKNNLLLFRKKMVRKGKDKQNIIALRNENQLYASLYVGAQVRDVDFSSMNNKRIHHPFQNMGTCVFLKTSLSSCNLWRQG